MISSNVSWKYCILSLIINQSEQSRSFKLFWVKIWIRVASVRHLYEVLYLVLTRVLIKLMFPMFNTGIFVSLWCAKPWAQRRDHWISGVRRILSWFSDKDLTTRYWVWSKSFEVFFFMADRTKPTPAKRNVGKLLVGSFSVWLDCFFNMLIKISK